MKLRFILLSFFLFAGFTFGQIGRPFDSKILEYSQKDFLKNAQWSLTALYVDNGEKLIDKNSEFSLAPASGLKLLTSAAALEILGSNFKFTTTLYYDGVIKNGTLNGNIYIVGGGDPTLGSSLVAGSKDIDALMKEWYTALSSAGIKNITGNIAADDFLFDRNPIPDNWYWIDIGNYYGAQASALTIHENLYYLTFKPAEVVGKPAQVIRVEPPVKNLTFTNFMRTGKKGSGDNGYIYAAPNQYNAVLRGTIPAGVDEFTIKGAIPDPPLFAAQYFKDYLTSHGIEINGKAVKVDVKSEYKIDNKLASTISPELKNIVYIINKRSNNLLTEQLLRMIAVAKDKKGGVYEGIEVLGNFLSEKGISTDGLQLFDGCGLSRSNMITTRIMTDLLIYMTKSEVFNDYHNSLGVAGDPADPGFFSNWGKNTEIAFNARIKSGSIDRVRSHSGYVKDQNGRLIAFSFIANNFTGSARQVDKIHENILIELARLK